MSLRPYQKSDGSCGGPWPAPVLFWVVAMDPHTQRLNYSSLNYYRSIQLSTFIPEQITQQPPYQSFVWLNQIPPSDKNLPFPFTVLEAAPTGLSDTYPVLIQSLHLVNPTLQIAIRSETTNILILSYIKLKMQVQMN